MFGLLFKGISSIASFVFPILASYRALEHNDITLIRPWLMYWVVIALQLTLETYFGFILSALPLYGFFRTIFLLWLVLPQTQGASQIYLYKLRPFLLKHDQDIDRAITTAQARAKSMGAEYISQAITFVQNLVYSALGMKKVNFGGADGGDGASARPSQPIVASEVDSLFSRFRVASGPDGLSIGSLKLALPSVASSGVGMLSSYLSSASSSKGITIPSDISNKSDRLNYLEEHKKDLASLLASIDEQKRSVELESDEDNAKDDSFDFVKKEEVKDNKSEPTSQGDTPKGESSSVESPTSANKGWFRFR